MQIVRADLQYFSFEAPGYQTRSYPTKSIIAKAGQVIVRCLSMTHSASLGLETIFLSHLHYGRSEARAFTSSLAQLSLDMDSGHEYGLHNPNSPFYAGFRSMAGNVQQQKPQQPKRTSQTQYFLPVVAGISLILIAVLFPYLGLQYGFFTPQGLSYTAIGLAIGALAIGVIYHAMSRKTLSDRIDRLQRRIDLLLLDPNSPLLSRIDDSKQELGHLQEDVVKLEKKVGQTGRSLTSEISAKISQIKDLLEL